MIWVVRDVFGGNDFVSYWDAPPVRRPDGHWFTAPPRDALDGWLGSLWIWDAWRVLDTVPDDYRQVIVADRDPARVKVKIERAFGYRVPKP